MYSNKNIRINLWEDIGYYMGIVFALVIFVGLILPVLLVAIDRFTTDITQYSPSSASYIVSLKNKFFNYLNYLPLVLIGAFVLALVLNAIRKRRYESEYPVYPQ